jgi:hypothetical protein
MAQTLKRLFSGSPVTPAPPLLLTTNTATTGGTIGAAVTCTYMVTALIGGVETALSNRITQVSGAGTTNTVTINWATVVGATGYKVYGRTNGSELLMATVGNVTSWTDTGSVTPAGALPSGSGFSEATATPGLYKGPVGKSAILHKVILSNPTASVGRVSLSVVPSGGTGGASNRIIADAMVQPDRNGAPAQPLQYVVATDAGDFITGYVTIAGIVITILGVEVS